MPPASSNTMIQPAAINIMRCDSEPVCGRLGACAGVVGAAGPLMI